jgi:hypothetical protein
LPEQIFHNDSYNKQLFDYNFNSVTCGKSV